MSRGDAAECMSGNLQLGGDAAVGSFFSKSGLFAIEESHRMLWRPRVGGMPIKDGIANRFENFVAKKEGALINS